MSIFVNFSNHPCNTWQDTEKAAALEINGSTEIRDVAFPAVPSGASTEEIGKLADISAARIYDTAPDLGKGSGAVLVTGEFSLVSAVLDRLQSKDITCVSGCSDRVVTEGIDKDGNPTRETKFEFVQFREYPETTKETSSDRTERPEGRSFVNLSLRDASSWPDAQKSDAEKIGPIENVRFPNVDSHMSSEDIKNIAHKTVDEVESKNPKGVLIAGEPGVARLVATELQKDGIDVYTATSERHAVEKDGVKTSVFEYDQLRKVEVAGRTETASSDQIEKDKPGPDDSAENKTETATEKNNIADDVKTDVDAKVKILIDSGAVADTENKNDTTAPDNTSDEKDVAKDRDPATDNDDRSEENDTEKNEEPDN